MDTIEAFIAAEPVALQTIVRELRKTAKAAMPGATETIYHGALGYSFGSVASDRVVYIMTQRGYVNLGFFFGTSVADPKGLLEGTGARMRHVKVHSLEEASNPALLPMVQSAWKSAPLDIAAAHERMRRK